MELIQVTNEIYLLSKRLNKAAQEVYKLVNEKNNTEREYRKELAKQIATLKSEGVQATLIPDLARGNIADLKFERDMSRDRFKTSIVAAGLLQSELSALQTINKTHAEVGA